ncbi:hypothetical protein [Nostoc sp. WHI]|uniref:hypothetical protein n=1 Tax=Nostoc sp. WHI TaxID=2650611 RepID=UPI0018C85415|nr:hypothetical protein [Nostoc sp. WHI]
MSTTGVAAAQSPQAKGIVTSSASYALTAIAVWTGETIHILYANVLTFYLADV